MAKVIGWKYLEFVFFLFGPFVKKYSDSNVERLLRITDYRDVTSMWNIFATLTSIQ